MSQYVVEAPDGTRHIIEGPDTTPPPSASDAAHAAGAAAGSQEPGILAAVHGAADTGTFGLSNYVNAGARYLGQHLTGVEHPDTFGTDLSYARGESEGASTAHPYSTLAGNAAGVVLGAGPLKGAISLATRAPGAAGRVATAVLQMHPAQGARNILRAAGLGGLLGATQADLDSGGDASAVSTGAAFGTAGGAAMGVVARPVMKVMSAAGVKANALLAKIIGVDEPTLAAAHSNFRAATATPANPDGTAMPMAALMTLKQQGALRDLAAANPVLASELMATESAVNAARPARMADVIESHTGPPQDIHTLVRARSDRMDAAMKPLHHMPITLDDSHASLLADPRVRGATAQDPQLRDMVTGAMQDIRDNGYASIPLADPNGPSLEGLRQGVSDYGATLTPSAARSANRVVDKIIDLGPPEYKAALNQHSEDSDYIAAFQHGAAGRTLGDAKDPSLIRALGTANGRAGHASGVATRLQNAAGETEGGATRTALDLTQPSTYAANREAFTPATASALHELGAAETGASRSLAAVTPSSARPVDSGDPQTALHALAAATYHSKAGAMYHLSAALRGLKMSDATAGVLARYLTDPKMTPQAYNILKRAGLSDQRINQWAGALALSVGSAAGEGASAGRGPR